MAGRQLGTHPNSYVNRLPREFDYRCGVIAATRSLNPFAGLIFKEPHDGTISVESTKISGMKDFITVSTTHCIAPSDHEIIKHTINFIKFGSFLCG